ncbi:NAD(P)H-quinone oxidoreductase subunit F [filamentous cyanobacterium LEGE 11480]|uniref:NAD(P)H-quinone oxidoreductase subunit F n=1 Tax=Romeriopsis navalis LEGE 11480 TaxID=2777977 RepID=A0A928Z1R8_9CYAN|nr:NAD(P)H-quinone oxidoreductase subunit F [Romeriopsis navalis]MBE9028292.1 NAD(P)H-quinone oxidoreductase subunit F [Romeriopsis navalis LEGE 11480]
MNQFLIETSWLIPCISLLAALATLPWSVGWIKNTGSRPAAYLVMLATIGSLIHSGVIFAQVWDKVPYDVFVPWLRVANLELTFALEISGVTIGAIMMVLGLGLLSQFYALGYLEKEWSIARFFSLLAFFQAAIAGLFLSNSFFLTYMVLECLTLSTYLIVGFWYAQPLVVTAARDAFLTKRVGDVLMLMGLVALATMVGSLNYEDMYRWSAITDLAPLPNALLGLALIAGPIGKCAQFPLHLWLDEAMEGPSPASILRNSVVVSAGAFVLIKLQPIAVMSPVTQDVLLGVGAMTAIGASLVSIAQIDIKRALSHSTSAMVGLVFIAVGMQWTDFALMLLLAHAVAKALLFMSCGGIVLATSTQDLTELGGLGRRMPATTTSFIVGAMGGLGLLPFGVFWALHRGLNSLMEHPLLVAVILLTNCLNGISLVRVYRLVFIGDVQPKTRRAPEVPWGMAFPMVALSIVTLLFPLVLERLELLPKLSQVNWLAVGLLIVSGVIGVAIGALMPLQHAKARPLQPVQRFLQDLVSYDFYIDRLYGFTVVLAVGTLSRFVYWFDRYVVDGFINLVGFASILSGEGLKYSVSGRSQGYMLTILLGVGLIGLYLTWSKGHLPF